MKAAFGVGACGELWGADLIKLGKPRRVKHVLFRGPPVFIEIVQITKRLITRCTTLDITYNLGTQHCDYHKLSEHCPTCCGRWLGLSRSGYRSPNPLRATGCSAIRWQVKGICLGVRHVPGSTKSPSVCTLLMMNSCGAISMRQLLELPSKSR
jgi:hypothetical protein